MTNNIIPLNKSISNEFGYTNNNHESLLEELLVMDHVDTHDVIKVHFGYVFTNRSY